ncbi:uncharacterized protein LOC109863272 [Pseudomyrmex gracilis]|uniref:uncharacterized protein LOC109863272 n=1 Tax=Pseudomyrmex gracilis TaxID=219809 RepID=UPI000995B067|nr:uncharacterized protein LOC109863272 [Pseudomyrmex gracilis]
MAFLLQANLNHCRRAQDLMTQSLAVAAEPYSVPAHPAWVGDETGTVAIYCVWGHEIPIFTLAERGPGFVAGEWGETIVVGWYFSPNRPLRDFEEYLDGLEAVVRRWHPRPVLVLGDFNAKSVTWGSPRTEAKEEALEVWMAVCGLQLLNRGSQQTCVRQHGGSIVDLSFASPAAVPRVSEWQVRVDVETLSDHRYVTMVVSTRPWPPGLPGWEQHSTAAGLGSP